MEYPRREWSVLVVVGEVSANYSSVAFTPNRWISGPQRERPARIFSPVSQQPLLAVRESKESALSLGAASAKRSLKEEEGECEKRCAYIVRLETGCTHVTEGWVCYVIYDLESR